jgi:hypothetical protein
MNMRKSNLRDCSEFPKYFARKNLSSCPLNLFNQAQRSQQHRITKMPSIGEAEVKAAETSPPRKCAGCEKPAGTLQCPKCLQLNILDSYFCDQDCFKQNWVYLNLFYADNRTLTSLFTNKLKLSTHSLMRRGLNILGL